MKSTERQKFEERWQEAFEESEIAPSDSVWSNIDLKLDNEKMKRRVVYYQRLAAATVLFALLIGIGGVRYFNSVTPEHIASQSTVSPKSDESTRSSPDVTAQNDHSSAGDEPGVESNSTSENQLNVERSSNENFLKGNPLVRSEVDGHSNGKDDQVISNGKSTFVNSGNQNKYVDHNSIMNINKYIPLASQPFENLSSYNAPLVEAGQLPVIVEENKKDDKTEIVAIASVVIEDNSDEIIDKEKKKTEGLWISFGAAAGSYNPGTASPTTQTMDFSKMNSGYVSQAPKSSRSSIGTAYSMGVTVGKKIADRWIIHTGINYLNQVINYTSNFATQANANQLSASVADYASQNSAPVSVIQPYKVSSSSEFVSIPLQAGYLLIDKKIGLQLNAGVASDIFLKNTLKDQSGQSNKYSQGSGEESPYRSLNWAGLASTELSYKVAKQYRISVMPGLRYSFQPALKAASGTTANPLILDIGFRFRYIFE